MSTGDGDESECEQVVADLVDSALTPVTRASLTSVCTRWSEQAPGCGEPESGRGDSDGNRSDLGASDGGADGRADDDAAEEIGDVADCWRADVEEDPERVDVDEGRADDGGQDDGGCGVSLGSDCAIPKEGRAEDSDQDAGGASGAVCTDGQDILEEKSGEVAAGDIGSDTSADTRARVVSDDSEDTRARLVSDDVPGGDTEAGGDAEAGADGDWGNPSPSAADAAAIEGRGGSCDDGCSSGGDPEEENAGDYLEGTFYLSSTTFGLDEGAGACRGDADAGGTLRTFLSSCSTQEATPSSLLGGRSRSPGYRSKGENDLMRALLHQRLFGIEDGEMMDATSLTSPSVFLGAVGATGTRTPPPLPQQNVRRQQDPAVLQRLYAQKQRKVGQLSAEHTFKPAILQASQKMDKAPKEVPRWQTLAVPTDHKEKKIAELARKRDELQMKECIFRPTISPASEELLKNNDGLKRWHDCFKKATPRATSPAEDEEKASEIGAELKSPGESTPAGKSAFLGVKRATVVSVSADKLSNAHTATSFEKFKQRWVQPVGKMAELSDPLFDDIHRILMAMPF